MSRLFKPEGRGCSWGLPEPVSTAGGKFVLQEHRWSKKAEGLDASCTGRLGR